MDNGVGARLKQAREAKGWTQEEAARHIGVSAMTLSRQERGQHPPQRSLEQIAAAYGVSADWILKGETRLERAAPLHPEIDEYANERAQAGRPVPGEILERIRRDTDAWEGTISRDDFVMLLPIAASRAEQLAKQPPPIPQGRRRVPTGRQGA